ncbi:hypothetical protein [Fibrobacter sp. UWEL]|uniref:hypothetical protein n=1 Tax=Fibrobacter sp. UWEL TaxID=1896209 RepID=UPI0009227225|nr:hypothetical protein [Fibrobacter sp. UWEL]SHL25963.1 hypothetical protein SAMN05720468_11929 [Fibrobacter sp. UWEL]
MEKISKLMGLLLLGLAGVGQAADPFNVACESVEEVDGDYSFDCSVYQSATGEYETWSDVIFAIRDEISMKESDVKSISITLESDITFDALPSDPASCTNSTTDDAQLYSSDWVNAGYNFDGANHTIKNFCLIGERGQSDIAFFKEFKNGSIKDVTFDNAYVMAKLDDNQDATEATAAVVVAKSENVAFENVTVKNSKVYGMDVGSVVAFANGGSFKNVTVTSTDVATPDAVFPEYTGVTKTVLAISSSSKLGGVAAATSNVYSFSNINLTAVSVGVNNATSVSYVFESINGPENVSGGFKNRIEGGVVGNAIASSDRFEYEGGSVEVTLGRGSSMAGLFGSSSLEGYAYVKNVKSTVSITSTCEEYNNIGGFMGQSTDKSLMFQNNKGSLTIDWKTVSSCGETSLQTMYVGGLVGYGSDFYSMKSQKDSVTVNFSVGTAYNDGAHAVGGLFGFLKNSLTIDAKNDYVTANISDLSTATDSTQIGGLVGGETGLVYSKSGYPFGVYRNEVLGTVKVSATVKAAVGGLIGNAMHGNQDLAVFHNVIKSDIIVPNGAQAGFVAGHIRVVDDNLSVAGNFHVGTKDVDVSDVIGRYDDESDNEVEDWNKVYADAIDYDFPSICFNYRNAISGLDATDADWVFTTGAFLQESGYLYNGVLPETAMKTFAFAHALNSGVYNKRGGASNDAIVLNDSWWSDGVNYPRYIDDELMTPYAPYMLTVDYSRVADQMTATQKTDMAAYISPGTENQFNAFTSNDKVIDPKFVASFKQLDWDYLMTNEISESTELESGDQTYTMFENKKFNVSYGYTYDGSDYYKFDDDGSELYFYTPRVDETSFNDAHLVPPIRTVGGVTRDYRLNGFIIDCEDESVCEGYPIEGSVDVTVVSSFARLISGLATRDFTGYSNTIRLIYKKDSDGPTVEALPKVYFANSESVIKAYVTTYGFTSAGSHVDISGGRSSSPTDIDYAGMTSEIGLATASGFTTTGWKVDLLVGFEGNYTYEDFNGCYDESSAKDFCKDKVIAAEADRNIGSVNGLTDSLMAKASDNVWKWSISLESNETIDMASLINAFSRVVNNGFSSPLVYMHITPKGSVNNYTISFIPNETHLPEVENPAENEIFFANSWKNSGTYSLESNELPTIYSTHYNFAGWTGYSQSERSNNKYSRLTSDLLDTVVVTNGAFNAYGNWTEKEEETSRSLFLIAQAPDSEPKEDEGTPLVYLNGTVELYQTYVVNDESKKVTHSFGEDAYYAEGESYAREYRSMDIPNIDESMTFHVTAKPNNGYRLNFLKDSVVSAEEELEPMMARAPAVEAAAVGNLVFGESDTTLTIESGMDQHYLVANFAPIPYHFQFTRELGSEWFYPKDWRDTAIYTIDAVTYQTPVPLIYSIAGTSKGWNTSRTLGENDSPVMYNSPISDNMEKGLYTETDTLYMILEKETATNATISLNKDAASAVRLVQFIGDKDDKVWKQDSISHSFTVGESNGEMLIPSIYGAVYEFTARIAVEKGYAIETAEYSFDTLVDQVSQSKSYSFNDGDVVALEPYAMKNIQFKVDFAPIPYLIAFENAVKEGAIDDGVSLEKREYTVESENIAYPSGLYTSESCLIGWKVGSSEKVLTSFNVEDFSTVKEGENTLTAVWGGVAACDNETSEKDTVAGEYNRLVLGAKGGRVAIVQMTKNADGKDSVVRTRAFGESMSMLFPGHVAENTWYVVNIVAADGYEAPETILFFNDDARGGRKGDTLKLANGDVLPSEKLYASVLKAEFVLINKTPIEFAETPKFKLSNDTLSLAFTTSEFDADRHAVVQKLFIADDDTLLTVDTVKTTPYVFSWDTTGLAPASYKISVKVFDETESAPFDTSFTIYGDTSVVDTDTTIVDTISIAFAQDPEFRISGSAAHMNFVTSEFNAEREALAEVILVRNGDTTISVDSVKKTPYEFTWDTVGLAPGKYELSVRVYDTAESASYDTSFVVTGEIAAASMDGWQMLALDVIDKKSVDWNDEDAVFYWWDESSSVGEYWQYQAYGERDEVDAVTGGWYSSLEGRSIELREDLEVPDSAVWKVSNVYSGWNLVANPYGWTIANPDTTLESWRWNSELCDYDTTRPWFLKPYEAIWVRVDSDTSLALDKTPVFDTTAVKAAAKRRVLAKANNKFDWSIRAVLQDEMGKTDSWNVLGAGETDMMEEPPEGMGNHVRLSIMEGRKRLAKSMKQISEDGYTWNLEVSATSNRRGYLSFEGLDRVEVFGYRLFVTVDDRTVELSAGEKLPVALKSVSKSVKVQVVKSEAQLAKSVSGLKMVQQGNRVNVSFNVPAELSGSGYIAEVAGLNGEKVSSSRGKATSGRNEVGLTLPKSGLYYVRVRVASQQTAGKFLAK